MLHALHRVDLDVGLLVAGEADVRQDQQRLRAIGDVEGAIEAHRLDAAFLASGLAERIGEANAFVVNLVGQL